MHYYAYELAHAIVGPLRFGAEALKIQRGEPVQPVLLHAHEPLYSGGL